MGLSDEIREFIRNDVRERFLRYVQIHTTSDESSETDPSTPGQWDPRHRRRRGPALGGR